MPYKRKGACDPRERRGADTQCGLNEELQQRSCRFYGFAFKNAFLCRGVVFALDGSKGAVYPSVYRLMLCALGLHKLGDLDDLFKKVAFKRADLTQTDAVVGGHAALLAYVRRKVCNLCLLFAELCVREIIVEAGKRCDDYLGGMPARDEIFKRIHGMRDGCPQPDKGLH